MKIMVETSARHIHLTQADLDTLFGPGYELTAKKALSQPGQFACVEKVEVVGPKSSIKLSILGPVRPETQIELAKTDARVHRHRCAAAHVRPSRGDARLQADWAEG